MIKRSRAGSPSLTACWGRPPGDFGGSGAAGRADHFARVQCPREWATVETQWRAEDRHSGGVQRGGVEVKTIVVHGRLRRDGVTYCRMPPFR